MSSATVKFTPVTYRTTAYDSLHSLQRAHRRLGAWVGGISALAWGILQLFVPLWIVVALFGGMMIALAILAAAGILPLRQNTYRLSVDDGCLSLAVGKEESSKASLAGLHPVAREGRFRVGLLPVYCDYVALELDGGPLGARTFFFAHDGEYAAKAWSKLGILNSPLDPRQAPTLAVCPS